MSGIKLLSSLVGSENTAVSGCTVTVTQGIQASGLTELFIPINTESDACGLHAGTGIHGIFIKNNTIAGFEPTVKGQAFDITDAGLTLLGQSSGDSGQNPVVVINASNQNGTAVANRDLLHIKNNGTSAVCVNKDGHILSSCFCGGLLGNATTATNATCLNGQSASFYATESSVTTLDGCKIDCSSESSLSVASAVNATNSTQLGGVAAANYVRKDIGTVSSSFPTNCLVFVYTDSSNVDHIRSDDGTNTYHFVHDAALGAVGNSTLCAGTLRGGTLCGTSLVRGATLCATTTVRLGTSLCTTGNLSILNNGAAVEVQTGCLLTSNSYADASNIPACGIWSKGNICSVATMRAVNVCGTSLVCGGTIRSATHCVGAVPLQESTDRPGLLEVNRRASCAWAGVQICYSSTAEWSFMANETQMGLYDDQQSEWALLYGENSGVCLYHNGSAKLCTCSNGAITAGIHCASTCSRSVVHCGTSCVRGAVVCATTAVRTTGTGLRVCAGTGCGCGVDWIASSDKRLKCDIVDYECGLDKINHLRPVCYRWKQSHQEDLGFIAQEVEEIEPLLVVGGDSSSYGLKYDKFAAVAVKAIQELSCEVKELKQEIELLKNK